MAYDFLYKPYSQGNLNPGGVSVLLPKGTSYKGVDIVGAKDDNVVESLALSNAGQEHGIKYYSQKGGGSFGSDPLRIRVTQSDGTYKYFNINNPANRYEGTYAGDSNLAESPGGAYYGGGNFPAGFAPGTFGYGAYPGYLGNQFPNPNFVDFNPIKKKIPYTYTDPFEFSQKYGDLSREEVRKNADLSNELALNQLNTELQGLQNFAPAASALRRGEISLDNAFNQAQRTGQLNELFPDLQNKFGGLESDLEAQRKRAQTFASGRAPDEITDRGLELTLRSRAADQASASGFGGQAADTISDRLSAETRLQLSQYGDQLLTQNLGARSSLINQRAALELAPTEYSEAGSQIPVAPSVSGASLAQGNLGQVNQLSMLSASQAFQGTVQQNQFTSSQEFARRQFNKTGQYNASVANANIANDFALQKFGYDVGYAGALAGAAQTDINTQLGLQQQAAANQAALEAQGQAQQGNQAGAIGQAIGTGLGIAAGVAGIVGATPSAPSTGGGITSGYTGAGAVNVGGVGYAPATSLGGGEGSIVVPSGQPLPAGYRPVKRTSNGGTIAVPIAGTSSGEASSGGGGSSSPRPIGSDEDFTGSGSSGGEGSSSGEVDTGERPEGTVQDPETGVNYYPGDYPNGYPGEDTSSGANFESYTRSASAARLGPQQLTTAQMQKFQEETNLGVYPDEEPYLTYQGRSVLSDAGIHYQQTSQSNVPIGFDNSGRSLFGDAQKMAATNPDVGTGYVDSFYKTFQPMGVFSKQDTDKLNQLAATSGDIAFINNLTKYWQNGDTKGFINSIAQKFKTPLINSITKDPQSREGLKSAFGAYNLYTNWDRMSNAQKALGLASVGLHAFNYSTGEDLGSKPIINATPTTPGLNVGQALGLFQEGYNVYSMVNHWNDMNTINKIASATNNVNAIAQTARGFGLLGQGVTGSAVSTSASQLAAAGYSAAPQFGVGAISGAGGSAIPAGYVSAGTLGNGTQVAIPAANANTAALGTSTLQAVAGGAAIAAGAYTVYKGWGAGGKQGALTGAVGGLSISAGLYTLGATNPYLLGGVVAASLIGNVVKTGKSEDQMGRDAVRSLYQKTGLADDKYNVTLANGQSVDIGIDGHGGKHQITNRDLLTDSHKDIKDLNSWDVDYTNDLDYASSMGGITLSRLLGGGTAKNIDQVGGQLGNAALGNIGYGQAMTKENFEKMAANQRSFFSQSGLNSKEDAVQLINIAEAEGRLSANDAITSRQAVNMFFDKDGYQLAQKLLGGRSRGIEVAATNPDLKKPTVNIDASNSGINFKPAPIPGAALASNGKYSYGNFPISPDIVFQSQSFRNNGSARSPSSARNLTKDEIRARNAARFTTGGASANGV